MEHSPAPPRITDSLTYKEILLGENFKILRRFARRLGHVCVQPVARPASPPPLAKIYFRYGTQARQIATNCT